MASIEKATNNSRETIFFSAKRYFLEGNRVKNQKVRAKVYVINFLLDGWDKAKLILEEIQMTSVLLSYIIGMNRKLESNGIVHANK